MTSVNGVRRTWIASLAASVAALALGVAGCSTAPAKPDPAVTRSIAPSGKLRVGAYEGSPTSIVRDPKTREPKGVTYDLGHELASRLGVPVEIVMYPRVAAVVDAIAAGEVDFTVTNATAARAKIVDFTAPVLALELGYLVPAGSSVRAMADADRPGVRIGVTQGSTSQGTLGRTLKNATIVPAPTVQAAIEMLAQGKLDLFATNKAILSEMSDKLPGSRILEGRWGLEHMAIGFPKRREAGKAYLDAFAADASRSGLVTRAADRAGLRGLAKD